MMKRGAQVGMTVCRTWAFSDGDVPNALQVSPGVINERVFKGLDYVIVEAKRHRIRLILSLVNNLNAFGGKSQYVKWAKGAGINVSSFFSNDVIKNYYKAYVKVSRAGRFGTKGLAITCVSSTSDSDVLDQIWSNSCDRFLCDSH